MSKLTFAVKECLEEIPRSRSRSFFFFAACFLTGVAIHSVFLNLPLSTLLIAIFLLLPAVFYFWGKPPTFPLLGIMIIFLGMLRFGVALAPWGNELLPWKDKNVSLQGIITKSVHGAKSSILTLRADVLRFDGEAHKISEKIIVFSPPWSEYDPGERLDILCVLRERKEWPRAASRWMCLGESVRPLGVGDLGIAGNATAKAQRAFLKGLRSAFPEPQGSLARGLILGNDFGFSPQLFRYFVITGTAHIVAVSGWNVTMIVNAILLTLVFLGIKRSRVLFAILVFIIFYVMLTGNGSSVLRAGIMGAISGLAWQIARPYRVKNALAAAALLMVIFNPRILVFDVGFILSFSATLGLVFLLPVLRRYTFKKIDVHLLKWSAETLIQTGAATIFTVPIILIVFGNLSLISPLANLLILPAVPVATMAAFAAATVGMINSGAGQIVGVLAWVPLTYIISVAELLSKIPLASVNVSSFWARMLILSIFISVFTLQALWRKKNKKIKNVWEIFEI